MWKLSWETDLISSFITVQKGEDVGAQGAGFAAINQYWNLFSSSKLCLTNGDQQGFFFCTFKATVALMPHCGLSVYFLVYVLTHVYHFDYFCKVAFHWIKKTAFASTLHSVAWQAARPDLIDTAYFLQRLQSQTGPASAWPGSHDWTEGPSNKTSSRKSRSKDTLFPFFFLLMTSPKDEQSIFFRLRLTYMYRHSQYKRLFFLLLCTYKYEQKHPQAVKNMEMMMK